MAKLVILITVRHDLGHQIAEAWREAGAPGVTFVESYGLRRLEDAARNAEILRGLVSMFQILRYTDQSSLMLLSVVEDASAADRLLDVAERTIGDMSKPDSGIAFVLDVGRTIGIHYSDHGYLMPTALCCRSAATSSIALASRHECCDDKVPWSD